MEGFFPDGQVYILRDLFQEFVGETCQRNSPVVFKEMDIAFLEYRGHICSMLIIVKSSSVIRELEDVK